MELTKKCTKCRKILNRNRFGLRYKNKTWINSECIKCRASIHNSWYIKNIEKNKKYKREYYEKNKERIKTKEKLYKKENPQVARKYEAKRRKRDLDKTICRRKLNEAIRLKLIKRQPCKICKKKSEAHHEDYSKPLEVMWLCPQHHSDLHRQNVK